MSVFKCKMCGGTIEFEPGATVGVCDSCGTKQTLPRLDDDRRANLYDRANHFRRNNDFDKAMGIYEQILNDDNTDAEAYWSLVLCRYGIEYVEDPATHRRVPTVNRAQFTSVLADEDYRSALKYADGAQRIIYEEEAKTIDAIQKGILEISGKEEPFDVFICYKETDASGRRTQDSVLANDLYHQLTQEGFKVFFARITLEDKLGTAYEPYIFAALNSAKVMVVLGTKPEYFNAVWVRNEWSRYLALVKQSGGKKILIPAYKDMDPYDLPEEFSHLQAQDMSKLGFMQDLIRGIKKITSAGEPASVVRETVTVNAAPTNTSPLLKRAFMFLEDGNWTEADEYCEKVLDLDPVCAEAYLGKLMAELHVKRQEYLAGYDEAIDNRANYQKVLRFADAELSDTLKGYITKINERKENERLTFIYNNVMKEMHSARTEAEYREAASHFKGISGFKDAEAMSEQCLDKAEICRKDEIYSEAFKLLSRGDFMGAKKKFESISGWKYADKNASECQSRYEALKAKQEAERLEAERKAEEHRIAAEKAAKKRKKIFAITTPIVCALIAFVIVFQTVLLPLIKYNKAVSLMDEGKYDEAISAFEAMDGYKDSADKITECQTVIKDTAYESALKLMNDRKYDEAISAFKAMDGYKDSADKITECQTAIIDIAYESALKLMNDGKYDEAIMAFRNLNGYRDSKVKENECFIAIKDISYENAVKLMDEGKYEEALAVFIGLNSYKGSTEKIIECKAKIQAAKMDEKYNSAISLIDEGNIIEAYEALISLNGYKDSAVRAKEIYEQYKVLKFKAAKVGDYIFFGTYEQDNIKSNGKEDIEWLVLAKEGNKVLIISRYALDSQPYNKSNTEVTWETCSLRKWLNETFINSAFNSADKKQIQSTKVTADKNPECNASPGNDTTDKVFLLSIMEVSKYFIYVDARKCVPTDYAISQGTYTYTNITKGGKATSWWWLRSPGRRSSFAADVGSSGNIYYYGYHVNDSRGAVRPAMWISINPDN